MLQPFSWTVLQGEKLGCRPPRGRRCPRATVPGGSLAVGARPRHPFPVPAIRTAATTAAADFTRRPLRRRNPGFVQRATDELIHRPRGVENLRGRFAAANGELAIEQANLDEYRGLVPVQVLMRQLVALELHDDD